jgi:hypothetical protein
LIPKHTGGLNSSAFPAGCGCGVLYSFGPEFQRNFDKILQWVCNLFSSNFLGNLIVYAGGIFVSIGKSLTCKRVKKRDKKN